MENINKNKLTDKQQKLIKMAEELAEQYDLNLNYDLQNGKLWFEFEFWTIPGEDMVFTIWGDSIEEFKGDFADYMEGFDPEEHAEMMKDCNGAPGIRARLQSADELAEKLDNIWYDYLTKIKDGK